MVRVSSHRSVSTHLPVRVTVPEPIIFPYLYSLLLCLCSCVFTGCTLRVSHFFFPYLLLQSFGRCEWLAACECEKLLHEESQAGSVSGPGHGAGRAVGGDRELELTVAISVRFQLKGWLYLTISGRWGRSECVCVGGVIPLPQVRWWTGERSHYEERWALSALPSCSFPSNLGGECASGSAFAYECERRWNNDIKAGCRGLIPFRPLRVCVGISRLIPPNPFYSACFWMLEHRFDFCLLGIIDLTLGWDVACFWPQSCGQLVVWDALDARWRLGGFKEFITAQSFL